MIFTCLFGYRFSNIYSDNDLKKRIFGLKLSYKKKVKSNNHYHKFFFLKFHSKSLSNFSEAPLRKYLYKFLSLKNTKKSDFCFGKLGGVIGEERVWEEEILKVESFTRLLTKLMGEKKKNEMTEI